MASIANVKTYYDSYDWRRGGTEWSHYWGSTQAMWRSTLLPRLAPWLPVNRAVEIGAGHGRLAGLLLPCIGEKLVLTDITPRCVEACRHRFRHDPRVSALPTDGLALTGVEANSIDFVVSFYSLVDADRAVIQGYVDEISRVLKPGGAAFIHHSNAGAYLTSGAGSDDRRLALLQTYRDMSMSAEVMCGLIDDAALVCLGQEGVNWDIEEIYSDCFTLFAKPGKRTLPAPSPLRYYNLIAEMRRARRFRSDYPKTRMQDDVQ